MWQVMRNWKYFTEDGFRSCYFDKQISVIKYRFSLFLWYWKSGWKLAFQRENIIEECEVRRGCCLQFTQKIIRCSIISIAFNSPLYHLDYVDCWSTSWAWVLIRRFYTWSILYERRWSPSKDRFDPLGKQFLCTWSMLTRRNWVDTFSISLFVH